MLIKAPPPEPMIPPTAEELSKWGKYANKQRWKDPEAGKKQSELMSKNRWKGWTKEERRAWMYENLTKPRLKNKIKSL